MAKRRANGEGSIYPQTKDKNGKTTLWAAQYTDNAGKKRTLYGKTQQLVREKLKEAIRQSDSGLSMDKSKILFVDWMEEWLEVYHKPTIRESSYAASYNRIHNHIIPEFQNVLLKDLCADMLQKYFNEKAKNGRVDVKTNPATGEREKKSGGLDVQTLMHLKSAIGQALTQAVDNNIIPQDVSKKVKLPPLVRKDVKILSVDEQKKLTKFLITSKNLYAFPVLLALYTGLRMGELRALRISDIDFDSKEIYVQRTLVRVAVPGSDGAKTKIIVNEPKTAKGKRTIPIPDFITDMLKKYIDDRNKRVDVLKDLWAEGWVDEGYIFITSNGKTVEAAFFNHMLRVFLNELGIKQIKFHALQHTFTTRCVETGFDIRSLSDILGHTEQKKKNMEKLSETFYSNGEL